MKLFKKGLDWTIEYIFPFLIIGLGLVLLLGLFLVGQQKISIEKGMIKKCNPNPQLYECQLYLAKKGKRAFEDFAITGGMLGGMVGGQISSN